MRRSLIIAAFALGWLVWADPISVAADPDIPAPPIWNGQDGFSPHLTLTRCTYDFPPIRETDSPELRKYRMWWRVDEDWESPDRGFWVNIMRTRLRTHADALEEIRNPVNPGSGLFFHYGRGKWDPTPVLGSKSFTIALAPLGTDVVQFVQDSEFVYIRYEHNTPGNPDQFREQLLRIGRTVSARIRENKEAGEGDRNRGHGNDEDHYDEGNPGQGKKSQP